MLKTSGKSSKKMVVVIKNSHTRTQMGQLDDEWADKNENYLSLAELIVQKQLPEDKKPADRAL